MADNPLENDRQKILQGESEGLLRTWECYRGCGTGFGGAVHPGSQEGVNAIYGLSI